MYVNMDLSPSHFEISLSIGSTLLGFLFAPYNFFEVWVSIWVHPSIYLEIFLSMDIDIDTSP
jgi:hypothetical protein